MIITNINRFNEICKDIISYDRGIGTLKEKAIHKVIKEYITEEKNQEIKIGKLVCDCVVGNDIYEIQTSNFIKLCPKLEYYLNNTEYNINIVYPIIASKRIIRVEKETGEILRSRNSPKKASEKQLLNQIFWISDYFPNKRIKIYTFLIHCEEHRYSDEIRYRNKNGRYDSITLPSKLIRIKCYENAHDLICFLPEFPKEGLSAKEFSKVSGLKGKTLYSVLNFYVKIKILEKNKLGQKAAIFFCKFLKNY